MNVHMKAPETGPLAEFEMELEWYLRSLFYGPYAPLRDCLRNGWEPGQVRNPRVVPEWFGALEGFLRSAYGSGVRYGPLDPSVALLVDDFWRHLPDFTYPYEDALGELLGLARATLDYDPSFEDFPY